MLIKSKDVTVNLKKEGFLGGLLVLAFAIFIVGFLAGVVAAFVTVSTEPTTLAFLIFVFGFVTGIVTVVLLLLIIVNIRRIPKVFRERLEVRGVSHSEKV